MLQWSWNGAVSKEEITSRLEDYKAKGMGGFFMHARPGLELGYISEEWFELWEHAASECERLGMEWHIYDEYTCPGGHAGGHVVAQNPRLAGQELRLVPVAGAAALPAGQVLGWFEKVGDGYQPAKGVKPQELSPENVRYAAVIASLEMNLAKGSFPLPNTLSRGAGEAFIQTTHEKYREYSGRHFGKTVKFMFCDEPEPFHKHGLPMSQEFLEAFAAEHGYRLEETLEGLLFERENSPKVRHDYSATVHRLYVENFLKPLHDWCAANKLEFTGHFMEHCWGNVPTSTSNMDWLRWMQAPGNDLLGCQFTATSPADNTTFLFNLKELASVAAQLGRKNVMVESSGAGGTQASFPLFKACEDYLMRFGVNIMDPHLSHYTLGGSRKYDFPQTISPHSPWYNLYGEHARHIGAVIRAQNEGQERNRVLVLHPALTGWIYTGLPTGKKETNPRKEAIQHLRERTHAFCLELDQAAVDFDLGDELMMRDLASAEAGKLTIGERSYELVIIPPVWENALPETVDLLQGYMESGGQVLAPDGVLPRYLCGEASTAPQKLAERAEWTTFGTTDELIAEAVSLVPPYLEFRACSI